MVKAVIFANPSAGAREGQQRRGMFPLPLIALADSLDSGIKIENVSSDLLKDYSPAKSIVSQSNAEWLVMTCYQETMKSAVELAKIAKNSGKKVVVGGAPYYNMGW